MAETKVKKQNMEFQTEVNQLLHLMIHSLYSNKEIFIRELISNASDACDKLRFEAISNDSLYEGDSELRIEVEFDEDTNTVTIRDNGIGMNREEVINNIGTIAKSGTKEFLSKLSGDAAKDSHLIGQFGVGFYSTFIVADKVTVTTRRAGAPIRVCVGNLMAKAVTHWKPWSDHNAVQKLFYICAMKKKNSPMAGVCAILFINIQITFPCRS